MTDTDRIDKALGLAQSSNLTAATLIDAAKVALDNGRESEALKYATWAADVSDIARTDAVAAAQLLS